MERAEAEIVVKVCLEAVHEQYVLPLTLALGTLTATLCRDQETADAVAAALRNQAASCPPDVAGRVLLEALAALAGQPDDSAPADPSTALRNRLRLIPGGNPDQAE